ncbi:Uncharacterised protein [Serratia fonticola]|uniref:hypothetical protein n=1 Tax=Serratia fonticola TaxID=47917 RepID=UPI00217815FD|nr:hypothetical protein [Serratia fonticola]CAI1186868.1 Uncharacterised protein [Serratia fonticola]
MIRWIQEGQNEEKEFQSNDDFKTYEDFLSLIAELEQRESEHIHKVSAFILKSDTVAGNITLEELNESYALEGFNTDMIVTLGCAWALAENPNICTWQKIRKLSRHSWYIEQWLREAMRACASMKTEYKKAFIELINIIFIALEKRELESESERCNVNRANLWNNWEHIHNQLEELFSGLIGADFLNYEEEMRLFGLLSDIDIDEFQRLLLCTNNPFLLDSMFVSSHVGVFSPQFAQWAKFVNSAPPAFEQNGNWTKSVHLPILLTHARDNLFSPVRQVPQYGANESETAKLTAQANLLVEAVIDTLSVRADAQALLARWSIWLMKQILPHREKKFDDIRSHDYIDNALLIAIGKKLEGKSLLINPSDLAQWEKWCLLCVVAFFSNEGFIDVPEFECFSEQWRLAPEDWHRDKGRELLQLSSNHLPHDHIPDLSAHFLVYPLTQSAKPESGWQRLWDGAYALREILEFGSIDAGKDTYSDRADASRLLLLLGSMGVACLDQMVNRFRQSEGILSEEIVILYKSLVCATVDVLHIDNTIYRDKWQILLQHLALRRVIWDNVLMLSSNKEIFTSNDEPDLQFYLKFLQSTPSELIAFLYGCIHNGAKHESLREEILKSSVDLNIVIEQLLRLNELRERRYRFDPQAVNAVKSLIEEVRSI